MTPAAPGTRVMYAKINLFLVPLLYVLLSCCSSVDARQTDDATRQAETLPAERIDAHRELPPDKRDENLSNNGDDGRWTEPNPPADRIFGLPGAGELFGYRAGNVHPFISLREEWTDNLYNVNFDEKSNFLTVVSPGIWFGLPRLDEIPLDFATYNGAVGGKRFFVTERNAFERFQAYLFAGLDYNHNSADSDLNHANWQVEGLFQYSMPFGLSWRFIDRLARARDKYDIGSFQPADFSVEEDNVTIISTPSLIRKYYANLASFDLNYDAGDNLSGLFNYSNFYLHYDDAVNEWLNRTDDALSFSLSYHYSPKTSFFVEYTHAFIAYDQDPANDSQDMFYYSGVNWKGSGKTSLTAKGGYQRKKFDDVEQDDLDTLALAAQLNYNITEKTKISLKLYKALEESDNITSRGVDTTAVRLRYDQRFSYRLAGSCDFSYEQNNYRGPSGVTSSAAGTDRDDLRFMVRPAIVYTFREWLTGELAYSFENRDSNENLYDYTSQTVLLSLNIAF